MLTRRVQAMADLMTESNDRYCLYSEVGSGEKNIWSILNLLPRA